MSLVSGVAYRHGDKQEATRASQGLVHRWALDTAPTVVAGRVDKVVVVVRVQRCARALRQVTWAQAYHQCIRRDTWETWGHFFFGGSYASAQSNCNKFAINIEHIENGSNLIKRLRG